jgi:hypothetical protein
MSGQRKVTIIILIAGAILLCGEYFTLRWYPSHKERVQQADLKLLPYQNNSLNLQMQVAAGIYGKVRASGTGIKIYRWRILGAGPSITITSQPNPSNGSQFSPVLLAQLETAGVREGLLGYQFQHMTLDNRDAYLVWQYDPISRSMNVRAQVMAPNRVLNAACNTGSSDLDLYTEACEETLKSIQLSGPPSNLPPGGASD